MQKIKPDKLPCKKTPGTQFTCFTSTKVQILTPEHPGIVRLMEMLDYAPPSDKFSNLDLYAAAQGSICTFVPVKLVN